MNFIEKNWRWFVLGVTCGAVGMFLVPRPSLKANTASQSKNFAMCTVPSQQGAPDAVFVLDFATGRLIGGCYHPSAERFTQSYYRNLAKDFNVAEDAQYVLIAGDYSSYAATTGGGGGTPATGCIYVGESISGMVHMYGFKYSNNQKPVEDQMLTPLGSFPWRKPLKK